MRRVADLVGIEEAFLARAVRGRILTRTDQHRQSLAVHRRFFAALALQDLVHEVPLNVVTRRYGANRGMLQSLQGSAATFAGMVTVFCEKLGWTNMELLLSQFQSRLSFGVERELCDLVRISLLNAARARMLYNAGYHTIASVAAAPPSEIENILHNAAPFVSGLKRGQETETEVRERSEARVIWVAGRRGLTEGAAAKLIVIEAKQLLQADVAQLGIQWKPPVTEENNSGPGSRTEAKSSSAADVSPSSSSSLRPVVTLQSGAISRDAGKTEAISKENVENSKTNAWAGDPLTVRQKREVQAAETGNATDGYRGQTASNSLGGKVPVESAAESSFGNVKQGVSVDRKCPNSAVKSRVDCRKTESATSKLRYENCVTASEVLQPTISCHAKEKPHGVPNLSVPSISTLGNVATPRSRNKRRSPIPEIPEPQEKLKRKETVEVEISEELRTTSVPEESKNPSAVTEVSADSKLCHEAHSVSVELYTEPFEEEEPAVQEKPVVNAHNDNNVMLDSQSSAACSLSDTCLMECDVIIEDGGENSSAHSRPVDKTKESPGRVVCDKKGIVTTAAPKNVAANESQDIIGEYDTQLRAPTTGEFQADQSFEFVSSFASPVFQSARCSSADNDLASSDAVNSFSLRLSSSDGCMDSDLSTLAVVELMEKEAEKRKVEKETETTALVSEVRFTEIKKLKFPDVPSHNEKSPAKKITHKETKRDVELEGSEMPDSYVVPSTPPRERKLSQADFKTRTSATPLSTRKRPSPRLSPHLSTPDKGLAIIDVTGHEQVFSMFLKEWRSQARFSLAVACERVLDNVSRIGGRFTNVPISEGTSRGLKVEGEDQVVVGIAVSWGGKDAYYVSLKAHDQSAPSQPDDSQAESAVDNNLTLARRVNAVKSVVQFLTERGRFMVCFDVKEHYKVRKCILIYLNKGKTETKCVLKLQKSCFKMSLSKILGGFRDYQANLILLTISIFRLADETKNIFLICGNSFLCLPVSCHFVILL